MWKLTAEQKRILCERYVAGEGSPSIARSLGVSAVAVRALLGRRGVPCRNQRDAGRTLSLDEGVFAMRGEEADYWAGFLMADGCVGRRAGNSAEISIRLAESDGGHLVSFRAFLGSGHAITKVSPGQGFSSQPAHHFSFRSDIIAADLAKYGIVPRKTMSAYALDGADSRHFWRGIVDGDGYIATARDGRARMELVGAHGLLTQFVAFLRSSGVSTVATVRSHKRIFRVGLCGAFAADAAVLLYDGCKIALPRKLNAANNILARALLASDVPAGWTARKRAGSAGKSRGGGQPLRSHGAAIREREEVCDASV